MTRVSGFGRFGGVLKVPKPTLYLELPCAYTHSNRQHTEQRSASYCRSLVKRINGLGAQPGREMIKKEHTGGYDYAGGKLINWVFWTNR